MPRDKPDERSARIHRAILSAPYPISIVFTNQLDPRPIQRANLGNNTITTSNNASSNHDEQSQEISRSSSLPLPIYDAHQPDSSSQSVIVGPSQRPTLGGFPFNPNWKNVTPPFPGIPYTASATRNGRRWTFKLNNRSSGDNLRTLPVTANNAPQTQGPKPSEVEMMSGIEEGPSRERASLEEINRLPFGTKASIVALPDKRSLIPAMETNITNPNPSHNPAPPPDTPRPLQSILKASGKSTAKASELSDNVHNGIPPSADTSLAPSDSVSHNNIPKTQQFFSTTNAHAPDSAGGSLFSHLSITQEGQGEDEGERGDKQSPDSQRVLTPDDDRPPSRVPEFFGKTNLSPFTYDGDVESDGTSIVGPPMYQPRSKKVSTFNDVNRRSREPRQDQYEQQSPDVASSKSVSLEAHFGDSSGQTTPTPASTFALQVKSQGVLRSPFQHRPAASGSGNGHSSGGRSDRSATPTQKNFLQAQLPRFDDVPPDLPSPVSPTSMEPGTADDRISSWPHTFNGPQQGLQQRQLSYRQDHLAPGGRQAMQSASYQPRQRIQEHSRLGHLQQQHQIGRPHFGPQTAQASQRDQTVNLGPSRRVGTPAQHGQFPFMAKQCHNFLAVRKQEAARRNRNARAGQQRAAGNGEDVLPTTSQYQAARRFVNNDRFFQTRGLVQGSSRNPYAQYAQQESPPRQYYDSVRIKREDDEYCPIDQQPIEGEMEDIDMSMDYPSGLALRKRRRDLSPDMWVAQQYDVEDQYRPVQYHQPSTPEMDDDEYMVEYEGNSDDDEYLQQDYQAMGEPQMGQQQLLPPHQRIQRRQYHQQTPRQHNQQRLMQFGHEKANYGPPTFVQQIPLQRQRRAQTLSPHVHFASEPDEYPPIVHRNAMTTGNRVHRSYDRQQPTVQRRLEYDQPQYYQQTQQPSQVQQRTVQQHQQTSPNAVIGPTRGQGQGQPGRGPVNINAMDLMINSAGVARNLTRQEHLTRHSEWIDDHRQRTTVVERERGALSNGHQGAYLAAPNDEQTQNAYLGLMVTYDDGYEMGQGGDGQNLDEEEGNWGGRDVRMATAAIRGRGGPSRGGREVSMNGGRFMERRGRDAAMDEER